MTATKYIILTLMTLVSSSFVVSTSGIDPMLGAFLAGGTFANMLRVGIFILLMALLVTDPPRSHKMRVLSAVASVLMLCMCGSQLFAFNTFLVDAFIYLELAIVFAIEALEFTTQSASVRQLGARYQKTAL